VRYGAIALVEKACLGAVWGGEHDGVLGFVEGAADCEKPLTGVSPLPLSLWLAGPACQRAWETEHGPRAVEWAALLDWATLLRLAGRELGRTGGSADPVPFLIFEKFSFFIFVTYLIDVCDFHI
jgi:hypothetical protein